MSNYVYMGSYTDAPNIDNTMLITAMGIFKLAVDKEGKVVVRLPQQSKELDAVMEKLAKKVPDSFKSFNITPEYVEIEVVEKPCD